MSAESKPETATTPDPEVECQPYRLMKSETVAIGRLITAVAELEHVITVAMFKVLGIDPLDGYVLFGKMTAGQRIGKLRAALKYKETMKIEKTEFDKLKRDIDDVIDTRNMFAHGSLMGIIGKTVHYLTTKDPEQMDDSGVIFLTKRIELQHFASKALLAETMLTKTRSLFQVTALHERYVLREAAKKSRGR